MDLNLRYLCIIIALLPAALHSYEITNNEGDYVVQPAYGGTIENTGKGTWIIDPKSPGPELPVVGQSLFDLVFSVDGSYQIPYPFTSLLERIGDELADPQDAIKLTMIPKGRSLRRHSVAPEYFNFPRVILAAEGEPAEFKNHAGLLLKGRFFIAYQEKTNLLEVISYNPEAGRFEFQEVLNYGPGLKPKVGYANRALCTSCHQNAGPIFSTQPWSETDASFKVSAKLRAANPLLPVKPVYAPRFDDVWAIGYASDRATYFSSSQFIWQQGCGVAGVETEESIRCRAAMLLAVLQYRLVGVVQQDSKSYKQDFLSIVSRQWQQRWPDGLYIATANIPDRDPSSAAMTVEENPLSLRAPRAFWTKPQPQLIAGIVGQLADFLSEADIRRIDEHLYQTALAEQQPRNLYRSSCVLDKKKRNDVSRIEFSCLYENEFEKSGFKAVGFLNEQDGDITGGRIDELIIPGVADQFTMAVGTAHIEQSGKKRSVNVRIKSNKTGLGVARDTSDLSARLEDGTLLESLSFNWLHNEENDPGKIEVQGQLTTIFDMTPLSDAVEQLANGAMAKQNDALSSKPFRRRSVLNTLYATLGIPSLEWQQDVAVVAPLVSQHTPGNVTANSSEPFTRYCAGCHSEAGQFPPGFMNGNHEQIKVNLSQCRQKILQRLSMWQVDIGERQVSPMPPAHWVLASGLSEREWKQSDAFEALLAATNEIVDQPNSELNSAKDLCL